MILFKLLYQTSENYKRRIWQINKIFYFKKYREKAVNYTSKTKRRAKAKTKQKSNRRAIRIDNMCSKNYTEYIERQVFCA